VSKALYLGTDVRNSKKDVFRENLRKFEADKSRKFTLDGASKWLALYAAILTTMLTTYTWIERFTPKSHSLEIYVADIHTDENNIDFTIAYYNTGDYSEVLSSAKLYLAQEIEGNKNAMHWGQAECNNPVLIEPGETAYKRYSSQVNFSDEDLKVSPIQRQRFELSLHFDFLSKEYGKASERFSVASLIPYNEGTPFVGKASVDFITTKKKVDFDDARPAVIKSSYPRDQEYVSDSFCGDEI